MPWDMWDPFRPLERNRRRAERIAAGGERARGTLVGLRGRLESVGEDGGSRPYWEFAVEVRGAGGPFRAGLRQHLLRDVTLRLGMELDVVHDAKRRTVIQWPTQLDGPDPFGWKRVDSPADGIDDGTQDRKALERGLRSTAVVERAGFYDGFWSLGMPSRQRDLVLLVADGMGPRRVERKRLEVPPYARHLVREGQELPVAVHPKKPDKVTIDWAQAAEAEPGVGVPNPVEPGDEQSAEPVGGFGPEPADIAARLAAPVGDERLGGITFDQWVEVSAGLRREKVKPARWDAYAASHGVAPGTWGDAVKAWQGRMMQDWTLGARYAEAFEAARKRR